MKNIIFISLLAISLFGCNKDILDRTPVDKKVVDNYYKTPAEANSALTATYNVLTWENWFPIEMISEIASDNCFGGAGASDGNEFVVYDRFASSGRNDWNGSIWKQYYTGISRANLLLEHLDNVNWGATASLKTKYAAEAHFLRAYFYFNLTRLFGKVPLVTKSVTPNDKFDVATEEAIYKQIALDLKFAADNLPATAISKLAAADYGRATKWAAQSMMARVYLYYTGRYNKPDLAGVFTKDNTKAYLDSVITKSGHDLVSDFASLWLVPAKSTGVAYAGEGNKECVFVIKFHLTNNNDDHIHDGSNSWMRFIGPRSYNKVPYGCGWGAGTVCPQLWNAYTDPNDVRKKASILSWEAEGITYTNVIDQRQYTGYNIKKYENLCLTDGKPYSVELGSTNWQSDAYEDFIEIRFADVLLMAAELNIDNPVTAQQYLDKVRTRAKAASVPATLTNIMQERRLEFAFEGIRYWDILRQCGTSMQPLIDALSKETSDPNSKFYVNPQYAAHVKGLFSVPSSEITLMNMSESSFEQNALYKDNSVIGNF